ncbi:MAG: hypothetical protein IJQ34_04255 [Kiritimatiellae bacterium]|nr:hypothetical protein [Kiritimatiellia bacterium]
MKSLINRLLMAIDYPERAAEDALSFVLQIDGYEIVAEETGARLVLTYRLTGDGALLPKLASYAPGRMAREGAVLSADGDGAFLWQAASSNATPHDLIRLFETFADSCDWWRERVADNPDGSYEHEEGIRV